MAGGGGVGSADGGRRTGGRADGRTGEGERENRNGGRSVAPARGGAGLKAERNDGRATRYGGSTAKGENKTQRSAANRTLPGK